MTAKKKPTCILFAREIKESHSWIVSINPLLLFFVLHIYAPIIAKLFDATQKIWLSIFTVKFSIWMVIKFKECMNACCKLTNFAHSSIYWHMFDVDGTKENWRSYVLSNGSIKKFKRCGTRRLRTLYTAPFISIRSKN